MNIVPIPNLSDCEEIAVITRPHGVDGEVLVSAKNIDYEDFKDFDFVFFQLQERLVPFFIEKVTIKSNSLFVKFEDISTIEKAELYCGTKIYMNFESEVDAEDVDSEFVGYSVIDEREQQKIGVVQEVFEYSMNILLDVLRSDNTSVLIPFANELVKEINDEEKKIIMEIPEGLLDA